MTRLVTVMMPSQNVRITPNWCGKALAVHRKIAIIDGEPEFVKIREQWVITDIRSGMRVGPCFRGSMKQAISFAKEWDALFAGLTDKQRRDIARGRLPQWLKDYRKHLWKAIDQHEKGVK